MTNGLSHLDESTVMFRGIRSNFIYFLLFENYESKQNSPRWDAASCIFNLHMTHLKDDRLVWVKFKVSGSRGQGMLFTII